jgi:hypothetical protein
VAEWYGARLHMTPSGSSQSGRCAFDPRLAHMANPVLCLLESPARKIFKQMAGQSNHFLITLLVGLAAVEDGTAELPASMRTSWAPHDRSRSAQRSREFAIKALLAWLVDAIDAYTRNIGRPPVVANADVQRRIEMANASEEGIAGRVRAVATATGQAASAEVALIEVAVAWRNRLVHEHSTSRISKRIGTAAMRHGDRYLEHYQGLVIDNLLERARRNPPIAPTFKEITAIVRSAHMFIERADERLLDGLDLDLYLQEILRRYLVEDVDTRPGSLMQRCSNVWGKSPNRCRSTIHQIAINSGLTSYREGASNELTDAVIERFVNLKPSQAIAALDAHR